MKAHELRTLLPDLLNEAGAVVSMAATAENAKQSLAGTGRYADRFHDVLVKLTSIERKVRLHLSGLHLSPDEINLFDRTLETLKAPSGKSKIRKASFRELKLLCETTIIPNLDGLTASPIPLTESVLAMDVVQGTRGYLEEIVSQINGCYEHQWYDGCAVLVRKLAEILIIEVYEAKGISHEIKDASDNFLMLSKLVQHIQNKTDWNLGRETKPCLDEMKKIGDHSAHVRNYLAKKSDIDRLLNTGLRVAVQELISRAGLK